MKRSFRHPQRTYHEREAGPWFNGAGIPHENSWAGRPLPEWHQDYQGPQWGQDPQRGQGPPDPTGQDPRWDQGPPDPQWDHPNPWWGQDLQNSQCYPDQQWNQYHPEQPSRDYGWGFDNGSFLHQGSGSYRRRSHGRVYGKRSRSFYKGPKSLKGKDRSHSSSRILVEMQQRKKENGSEVKEDESAIPKETKQAQEDSVASVENTNPPQQRKKENGSEVKEDESAIPKETKQAQEDTVASVENTDPPQLRKKENGSEVKEDELAIPKETKQAQEDSVASVENTDPPQLCKKENDSEVKEDESAIPKETKQAQEDSVASVENTDPPQVSQEASKAIISPSQFSFRLPPDSLTCPPWSPAKTEDTEMISQKASKAIISPSQFSFRLPPDSLTCPPCSPAKTEDIKLIKPGTRSKTEDNHQVACCTQAATSELPATLENLELKKEDKEIDLVPETKQDMNIVTLTDPSSVTELSTPSCAVEPSARLETREAFLSLGREEDELLESSQSTDHFNRIDSPPAVEIPFPSDTTDECRSEGKEELELLESSQSTDHFDRIDSPPAVEIPFPSDTTDECRSEGKEELELLESSQSTDHFDRIDSPPAVEIPFPSDTTDECRSEGKEELELTQMGDSHEDTDCSQASDALAGGTSSALPVIPSDVHSVPVLVSGKETEQPYFWESESSLHAPEFNWSHGGKGWAPEDYQEPSWALDKAKKCGDISEPERNLVLPHSSFHSRYSSDQSPDTGSVLESRSSSSRSRHNSDSKHSSTQRTIKCLRSPLRQGSHSRSPLRRRWHSRSPLRQDRSHSRDSSSSSGGSEITRTDYCSKCHCKCCRNLSQKRFRERVRPHSYSTHKMHRYHPSKETNKSYRTSHSYSPENSTMTRKKKSTRHEETKKGRSASVKRKGRSTSVKQVKSSKVTLNGRKVLAPINHDAALAVETSIPAETTEHFQSANTEVYESVQLAPSSEDTGFAHQSCARKETGTSAPSGIVEDPRSVAVLTKTNQIEEDYLQVMLNFAVVATMLLQKEPCMEHALEVALRANMRSVGDYYESMLKNFIDNYDLSETH